jgi:hypothetical protein
MINNLINVIINSAIIELILKILTYYERYNTKIMDTAVSSLADFIRKRTLNREEVLIWKQVLYNLYSIA